MAFETMLDFVKQQEDWAAPVVFVLAFGESLAFLSLLLPATALLLGIGGLVGATGLGFWPIWLAAVLGGVMGDWASYWLGLHFQYAVTRVWPLSRRPDLLARGERFFRKWGASGVFLGRFLGPLRAVVPLVAGICGMPVVPFQTANVASALVWATGLPAPGAIGVAWLL